MQRPCKVNGEDQGRVETQDWRAWEALGGGQRGFTFDPGTQGDAEGLAWGAPLALR
jgi:hypothetical protein